MSDVMDPPVNYIVEDMGDNTMFVIVEISKSVVPKVNIPDHKTILQNPPDGDRPPITIVVYASGKKVDLVDQEDDLEVTLNRYPSEDDPNKLSFYAFVKYRIV